MVAASEPSEPTHSDDTEPVSRSELRTLVGDEPGVELRPMFGTLAALVDGHVFAVAMGDLIGVKLGPDALAELAALPGSEILTMGTRRMKAYRSLPAGIPDAERRAWLTRARLHVARQHS
ncbi:TfoX/Sxy family protein [Terracoccus sp. 273MFTsu3.1]|uniref:TfoX/Sxy family protein n=1 Tax=Terracoccus sp. 273MFTsu3.1 TaxID=1172188 RepID=UPI000373F155|nr:TfoX/Sxy family protein [Terracoccus sp. 273MFTsu3.1]